MVSQIYLNSLKRTSQKPILDFAPMNDLKELDI